MGELNCSLCVERGLTRLQVDFEQEDGSHIKNIISDGEDGGLYMTYAFEFRLPDVQEGSEKAGEEVVRFKGVSTFKRCGVVFRLGANDGVDGEEGC